MSRDPSKGDKGPHKIEDLLDEYSKRILEVKLESSLPPEFESSAGFSTPLGQGLSSLEREIGDESWKSSAALQDFKNKIDEELKDFGGSGLLDSPVVSPQPAAAPLKTPDVKTGNPKPSSRPQAAEGSPPARGLPPPGIRFADALLARLDSFFSRQEKPPIEAKPVAAAPQPVVVARPQPAGQQPAIAAPAKPEIAAPLKLELAPPPKIAVVAPPKPAFVAPLAPAAKAVAAQIPARPAPKPASAGHSPNPRRRRWAVAVASGLLLLGFAARRWPANPFDSMHRAFLLPYTDTAGLTIADGHLVSVDPRRQLLFLMTEDGQVKAVQNFSNESLSGLAWGDGFWWSTDAKRGHIYQHDLDAGHSILKAYANADHRPSAVYWDGRTLWTGDARTETINQFTVGGSLGLVKQYTLAGVVPVGFYLEKDLLWVFDSITRKILRYKLGASLVPVDSVDLNVWLTSSCNVTGFAVDKENVWLITQNPAQLHRFGANRLAGMFSSKPGAFSGGRQIAGPN